MRVLRWLVAVAVLGAAPGPVRAADPPVRRIDRMWVVGAPVLTDAPRGLYVWVEDKTIQLAVVGKGRVKLRVEATKGLNTKGLGDFRVLAAPRKGEAAIEGRPKDGIARGRIESAGDVKISDVRTARGRGRPIFVGPLAKRAAASVTIGRF